VSRADAAGIGGHHGFVLPLVSQQAAWLYFGHSMSGDTEGRDRLMYKQILMLAGVIAIVVCAVLTSMYILDLVKLPELTENLRKILSIIVVSTAAGLLIMALLQLAKKN
jgi:hypothetical protein